MSIVIELAQKVGWRTWVIFEKNILAYYKIKNILKADCAFVTGTAAEIQSIKSIKNIIFKKNNKIFNLLKESYESLKKNSPDKVLKIRKIL